MRAAIRSAMLGALLLTAESASAAEIEFGWSGTVSSLDPALAAVLPPGSGVLPGANGWVRYVFESTTADADPGDPDTGAYPGALRSWSLQVGSYLFRFDAGGSVNTIDVLIDPFLTLYEATASVTATPPLSGFPALNSDVLFLSLQSDALPDDSLLLSPPDPTDPKWDIPAAAIIDPATATTLIDIDLTAICTGACQPGPPSPPVPMPVPGAAIAVLGAGLVLCGSRMLCPVRTGAAHD
jgi:hypothetical protein